MEVVCFVGFAGVVLRGLYRSELTFAGLRINEAIRDGDVMCRLSFQPGWMMASESGMALEANSWGLSLCYSYWVASYIICCF